MWPLAGDNKNRETHKGTRTHSRSYSCNTVVHLKYIYLFQTQTCCYSNNGHKGRYIQPIYYCNHDNIGALFQDIVMGHMLVAVHIGGLVVLTTYILIKILINTNKIHTQ